MLFVPYLGSRTLSVDLPQRADASPTFTVYSPSGGSLETGTATLADPDTMLAGAAGAGATSVTVDDATGITVGLKYLLGGPESAGGERVTVRAVSGTTVALVRPLRLARASGDAFQSTAIGVDVSTDSTGTAQRSCRVEIAWDVSAETQPPFVFSFDCTRYDPVSSLTADDVVDLDPAMAKRLPAGLWMPAAIARTWDMILRRVATKVAPGALVGTIDLTTAHSYLVRSVLAETAGEEWAAYRDDMRTRFGQELEAALAAGPVDSDQDGAIEPNEAWTRGITVSRA